MQGTAQVQTDEQFDDLAERFFSEPQAWEDGTASGWQPRVLSARQTIAIVAAAVPIVLGAVAALCLALFSDRGPTSSAGLPDVSPLELAHAATPTAQDPTVRAPTFALPVNGPQAASHAAQDQAVQAPAQVASGSAATLAAGAAREEGTAAAPPAAARGQVSRRSGISKDRQEAKSVTAQARRALDGGDAHKARVLATEAIRLDPTRAAPYILLAGAADALDDRAGLQAAFRACVLRATDALASACKSLAR